VTDFFKPVQVRCSGRWFDATVIHLFTSERAVVVCGLAFAEVAVTFDHLNCDIRNTPQPIPKQGVMMRAADFTKPIQVLHKGYWHDATVVHVFADGAALVFCLKAYGEGIRRFNANETDIRNTPPAALKPPETEGVKYSPTNTPTALIKVAFTRLSIPKGALWRLIAKARDSETSWLPIRRYGLTTVDVGGFTVDYSNLLEHWEYSIEAAENKGNDDPTWHSAGRRFA